MLLVLDNYDSFTYNIVQYIGEFVSNIEVHRNDKITVSEIVQRNPRGIIISPGPKTPQEAGVSCEVVRQLAGKIPLLGVCLGHQSIGHVFGGRVVRAPDIKHGKTSRILHFGSAIFQGIPKEFIATRYHSLIVEKNTLPACLRVTAESEDGLLMALEHRHLAHVYGVQFHPESILTSVGLKILQNFVSICFP